MGFSLSDLTKAVEDKINTATASVHSFVQNQVYEPLSRVTGAPTGNLSEAQLRAGARPATPTVAPSRAPAASIARAATEAVKSPYAALVPIGLGFAVAYVLFSRRGRK